MPHHLLWLCNHHVVSHLTIVLTKSAGSSTPKHKSRSPIITPVRAAQLKTTYITQIKELHSLVEIGALTPEQYEDQRDPILHWTDLTPGSRLVYDTVYNHCITSSPPVEEENVVVFFRILPKSNKALEASKLV